MAEGAVNDLEGVLEDLDSGNTALVLVESGSGSAQPVLDQLSETARVHERVRCAPVCWANAGGVVDDLRLDEFHGGTIVLEDAQWADPTSLGRLQRMLKENRVPMLLILAHRPMAAEDGWWIEQLAETAEESARVERVHLPGVGSQMSVEGLDARSTELIVASRLSTGALSVPLAARLLEIDEADVLSLGDDLVARGLLRQARGGYMAAPEIPEDFAGEARIGFVAGKLADALSKTEGRDAMVGALLAAAGRLDEAFPVLARAAADAEQRNAPGEAYHLAAAAISAGEEAGTASSSDLGRLHRTAGKFLRDAGRTQLASGHIEQAASLLEGPEKVDALRLGAAIADDTQHPQDAERLAAMAELEAVRIGESSELGSLFAFRARSLNRIGFADEADAVLAKGEALLVDDGTREQRFRARQHRAWIHFDRGEAALAEAEFTHLRDDAAQVEGEVSLADKEAWRARALFPSGRPDEGLEAVRAVYEIAAAADVEAPVFLAQLALTEGNLAFGRYEEALEASERVLDLVERQLPAWENMARVARANAFLGLGRLEEASAEIDRALAKTPEGANGWRWRTRATAVRMEIETANGSPWPDDEADDLADLMLHSRLHGWAAELLCAIAEHGKRSTAAEEALAVAVSAGLPLVAARAAHAGDLWRRPIAVPAIQGVRAVAHRIPPDWESAWSALPHIFAALQLPEPVDDSQSTAAAEALEEALRRAGLTDDRTALSPAQRRTRGLVGRGRPVRVLRLIAAALGVVVLAAGTALGVNRLSRQEPVPTTSAAPIATETAPPSLEETQIAVPASVELFAGTTEHRGGPTRSGSITAEGPDEVSGYYWRLATAGPIEASPITYGRYVYIGSTEGTFYALDQSTGDQLWTMAPQGRISTAPVIGEVDPGEGNSTIIVVVDDNGVVRGHDAVSDRGITWTTQLDGRIRSTPVLVGGIALVATSEGFVHGIDMADGTQLWRYPSGEQGLGVITADLAFAEGLLLVGSQSGVLHVLDVTGEQPAPVCEFDAAAPIVASPMIVDDIMYVPTTGQNIWVLPFGACSGIVPDRLPFYVTETPVEIPPAIVGDTMYIPEGRYLYAKDLVTNTDIWPASTVNPDRPISAPPVVAGDTVYFASEDGVVHAVDATTGEPRWEWHTGLHVRGAPAIVDGVVFIGSGDGNVYAVGG
ncbi:MAG TPA: PQQ-binding-like beta-propeller repeat protein [Acidimicrobiia bacterium]|nr:PQQ-binding-like beta-propeller repeat protein [Acidimicrobiia bacterium]